jgi:Icc-related predicted phosphoesterase
MKLQIMSDLHNEFEHKPVVRTDADVIILAGDINVKASAIPWILDVYKDTPVVYIAGNHEYYHSDILHVDEKLKKLSRNTNIKFLQNTMRVVKGVRFLGTTLWTDFHYNGPELRDYYMKHAGRGMNDFNIIKYDGKRFTPKKSFELHVDARHFLKTHLEKMFDGKTVIVTHHAPYNGAVSKEFLNSPLNPAFISDMSDLMLDYKPDLWVYGHLHSSFRDVYVGDTRVVSNPRGYPHDAANSPFLPDFTVNL